ncbi:glycosyltransferase family 61 [Chlorella sorokiniana]|uniref:Glycosyltransferase family 61 n=1 Tax=Chlorella sorokiniana TaxID=3076 RepID=A0A2P6TS85_CHLSO|nr:glycosyltransferase family 61 [Chlorella sorokiniana]|eukprot:PRW56929.1 glycosyltransferase family 61 [Chlorella sorokiniana]
MAARRRGPPPAAADAAAPHGGSAPDQQPSTSGRQAGAGPKSSSGGSRGKGGKAQRGLAADGKLRPLTIASPLLVLLLALLAALAVKQWPPDGLLGALTGGSSGDSSDSSSGGIAGGREEGGLLVADARGFFPKGCKWREVQEKGEDPGMWGLRRYQYWDAASRNWTEQQPAACVVPGLDPKEHKWRWRNGSPRSAADCNDNYCLYENLWFNNGRFYLLVDGEEGIEPWKLTRNQELNIMHVNDARQFVASTPHRVVPGDTLVFDFVFFLHPTAIGHWSEMLFPLFSILRQERSFARPPTQFLQLHLKRCHMMEWVRANLATALGVGPKQDLPPIMFQTEVADVGDQMAAPLEGIPPDTWVALDRVLVVKDIFTGGVRTFLDRRDAHLYRKMLYAQYGLPTPRKRSPLPRVITFQRKRANRRVVNEPELLKMLGEFGEVRVVEFNASTPFKTQLETMASTSVLVSVHTSNLANAQFLQPGSAVFEIIQRNWFWHGLDRSFQVQTEMMGDIHHYAWRATGANETRYIEPRDQARFGDWEPLQCNTEECVEAHTNVDVIVDIAAFRALLADRLPLVFAGWPVEAAALPWPEQEGAAEAEAEDFEDGP